MYRRLVRGRAELTILKDRESEPRFVGGPPRNDFGGPRGGFGGGFGGAPGGAGGGGRQLYVSNVGSLQLLKY